MVIGFGRGRPGRYPDRRTFRLRFRHRRDGYFADPTARPEFADFADQIRLWRDQYVPPEGGRDDYFGAHPYLGLGHELLEKSPGAAPFLRHIHLYNPSGFVSFGLPIGDVPSIRRDVPAVVSRISRDLFLDDLDAHERRINRQHGARFRRDPSTPARFGKPPKPLQPSSSMTFQPDLSDTYLATAVALREQFATDAVARDKAGGRPSEQIRLLKASGLPSIQISAAIWRARRLVADGAQDRTGIRPHRWLAGTSLRLSPPAAQRHLLPRQRGPARRPARPLGQRELGLGATPATRCPRPPAAGATARTGCSTVSARSPPARTSPTTFRSPGKSRTASAWLPPFPPIAQGLVIEDDWDGIGQRQTGSGTVTVKDLRVFEHEIIGTPGCAADAAGNPDPRCSSRRCCSTSSSAAPRVPWRRGAATPIRARGRGSIRASNAMSMDPWVKRVYGDLYIKTLAAAELADDAARSLDAAYARGEAVTEEERGRHGDRPRHRQCLCRRDRARCLERRVRGHRGAFGHQRLWLRPASGATSAPIPCTTLPNTRSAPSAPGC